MRTRQRIVAVLALSTALAVPAIAQPSATAGQASSESTASPSGIETRFELGIGAVFVDTHGSRDKFWTERYTRSGFNTGVFRLDLRPVDETDQLFDFATLSAAGIGNSSPYQRADFRMGKRRSYDLTAGYRKYKYFFGLPEFASGLHSENSVGRSFDANLRLLPDRKLSFLVGYRRSQLFGTRYSSQDLVLDTYSVLFPRRLASDEFVMGAMLKSGPFSLSFNQSFLRFRDEQVLAPNPSLPSGLRGNTLESGQRAEAMRSLTPVSRVVGRYQRGGRYDLVGRYIYSGADMDITRSEDLLSRVGPGQFPVRQIITSSGVSEKPTHNASVAQTASITDRLIFHHRFQYETYTLTGLLDTFGILRFINDTMGSELDLPFTEQGGTVTDFRQAVNETELEYIVGRDVSLVGGYRYRDRHLAFGDQDSSPLPVVTITHAGGGGVLWRPGLKVRLRAEVEKGTNSEAFNRTDPLSFLRWKIRGQYRPTAQLTITANAVFEDNSNDSVQVNYDLDNRQVGALVVYVPSQRLVATGGYNFFRIRTSTDIVFYALSELMQGKSLYETNTHVAHAQLQIPLGQRVGVRLGYEFTKDTGTTYPLRMHTPRAGFSMLLYPGLSFEADWRHYSYNERLFSVRDYGANVLSTGLRFTH